LGREKKRRKAGRETRQKSLVYSFSRASDCALQSKRPANINTAHVRWQQGQYRTTRANNRGCNTIYFPPPSIFINIFTKKEKGGKKKSKKCTLLHEGMLGWLSARAQITHPWWLDQPSTGGFEAPKTKVVIRVNMSSYGMRKSLKKKMTHF